MKSIMLEKQRQNPASSKQSPLGNGTPKIEPLHKHHLRPHLPPPTAVDERSSLAGLRAIASIEAVKGIAVILLMLVIFSVHSRVDAIAESLLYHLHMNPDKRIGEALLNFASKLGDTRLITIAAMALSYATVRFVESWGLWHRRVWAEWFALLSGALYLPWEIAKLAEQQTWLHATILIANLIVVGYMAWVRIASCRPAHLSGPDATTTE